ncbi:fasciclin domain-containing protein [Modestobacter excelsi]|uniref:fasciclin domain-containing protein n=1 Tax=Modestobacter excelsi TaxID=2213161 RepID=UPI00110CC05C|nr:fasciclin domain-containing protein [Modestobacter excelsi]
MKAARLSRATTRVAVGVAVPVLLAGLTACSSGEGADTVSASSGTASSSSAAVDPTSAAPVAQGPIGAGCDVFPAAGPGSAAAIATAPVGIAVSTVPQLSTLTQAIIAANLVDVVNTREDVTVLAPSDAAFAALGPDAVPGLLTDVPRLTTLLTHHVVPGRLTPDQLVGEHTTLNGDSVTVAGPAGSPTITADQTVPAAVPAAVVCGDLPTANATLYVIDQVLAPAG